MFHRLKIPDLTKYYLTDLVLLQIELLEFASTLEIKEFDDSDTVREDIAQKCAAHLKHEGSRFAKHAQDITQWLFRKEASVRSKLLPDFAIAFQREYNPEEKNDMPFDWRQQWLRRIKNEINAFLKLEKEVLEIKYFYGVGEDKPGPRKEYPDWQLAAGKFFIFFYLTFLEGDDKIPPVLFTCKNAESFGRQQFLKAFRNEHPELEICPACDAARYYTESEGKIYTTIDHFLPKEFYPHFACHPYNLIPTCHSCNSSIKGVKNPLEYASDGPGRIRVSALPYSQVDISNNTYLKVDLGKGATPTTIEALLPRQRRTEFEEPDLSEAIRVLYGVYKIPHRWSGSKKKRGNNDLSTSDCISETLFRRMRQFLGDDPAILRNTGLLIDNGILRSSSTALEIYNTLKFLLYYLDAEDRQKDPFAFALTWMLATLIEEDVKPLLPLPGAAIDRQTTSVKNTRGQALLEEINAWFGPDFDKQQKRDQHTDELLSILRHPAEDVSNESLNGLPAFPKSDDHSAS